MSTKKSPRAMPIETIITRFKARNQQLVMKQHNNPKKPVSRKSKPEVKLRRKDIIQLTDFKNKSSKIKNSKDGSCEFYPDKPRRRIDYKKIVLKPKHSFKVIGGIKSFNKRKLHIPQKEIKLSRHNSNSSILSDIERKDSESKDLDMDLSIKDMVLLIEEQGGLDDEDMLEILTCPSPVWWEDHPDGNIEDPICELPKPAEQMSVKNQLLEEQNKDAKRRKLMDGEKNSTDKDTRILNVSQLDIGIDKHDVNFRDKRFKLESLLSSLRNKVTGDCNSLIKEDTNITMDINEKANIKDNDMHNKKNICNLNLSQITKQNEKNVIGSIEKNYNETDTVMVSDASDHQINTKIVSDANILKQMVESGSLNISNDYEENIKQSVIYKVNSSYADCRSNQSIESKQKNLEKCISSKNYIKNDHNTEMKIDCYNTFTDRTRAELKLKNILSNLKNETDKKMRTLIKRKKRYANVSEKKTLHKTKKRNTTVRNNIKNYTQHQNKESTLRIKKGRGNKNYNKNNNILKNNEEKVNLDSCDEDILNLEDHEIFTLENIEIPIAPNNATTAIKTRESCGKLYKSINDHANVVYTNKLSTQNCNFIENNCLGNHNPEKEEICIDEQRENDFLDKINSNIDKEKIKEVTCIENTIENNSLNNILSTNSDVQKEKPNNQVKAIQKEDKKKIVYLNVKPMKSLLKNNDNVSFGNSLSTNNDHNTTNSIANDKYIGIDIAKPAKPIRLSGLTSKKVNLSNIKPSIQSCYSHFLPKSEINNVSNEFKTDIVSKLEPVKNDIICLLAKNANCLPLKKPINCLGIRDNNASSVNEKNEEFIVEIGSKFEPFKNTKICINEINKPGIDGISNISKSKEAFIRAEDKDHDDSNRVTEDHEKIKPVKNTKIFPNEVSESASDVDNILKGNTIKEFANIFKDKDHDDLNKVNGNHDKVETALDMNNARRLSTDSAASDKNMSVEYLDMSLLDEDENKIELDSSNPDFNNKSNDGLCKEINRINFKSDLDITDSNIYDQINNSCNNDIIMKYMKDNANLGTIKYKDVLDNQRLSDYLVVNDNFRTPSPNQEKGISDKLIQLKDNLYESKESKYLAINQLNNSDLEIEGITTNTYNIKNDAVNKTNKINVSKLNKTKKSAVNEGNLMENNDSELSTYEEEYLMEFEDIEPIESGNNEENLYNKDKLVGINGKSDVAATKEDFLDLNVNASKIRNKFKSCKTYSNPKRKTNKTNPNDNTKIDAHKNLKKPQCRLCSFKKKSISISENEAIRYCLVCSSIYDTDCCKYCIRKKINRVCLCNVYKFVCDKCGTKVSNREEMVDHLKYKSCIARTNP